jgi:hypothetical protein
MTGQTSLNNNNRVRTVVLVRMRSLADVSVTLTA